MNIFRNKKSQALLELALFGAILIMLIGIILNYGLRYNFEQKTAMNAFRKALVTSEADGSGQATVLVMQDKHIPNPSNPFAVGSVMPFMSSASVVRSSRLHETADTYAELPQVTMQVQGQQYTYKTAGFVDVYNAPEDAIKKYKEIYGSNNVWETGNGDCVEWEEREFEGGGGGGGDEGGGQGESGGEGGGGTGEGGA